ncbi:F [Hemileuca sp. nucleopolyhedrovirus]|uniref:F n=1 Tax=Hemileuca sp. nucleopolyhedrovirus TaxID=1367203 RepID=S5MK87_9ABAC|nr:F [Hemileuca sp. nucleopolyhedrovirus] [Hemileuca sp. nucleopolyhedrovirus]AGR56881.1 F [Hemileuca sp. nucleopolyhedrovirus] [Hemileuca sp. nucleopolyhedrovirus]
MEKNIFLLTLFHFSLITMMALTNGLPESIIDSNTIIEVNPLPHTSGFYYQPINKMQFVENIWTFVIEMDHGDIFMELDNLYEETHKFIKFISSETISNCSSNKIVQTELHTFVIKQILSLVKKHNDIDSKIPKSGVFDDHHELTLSRESAERGHGLRRKRGLLNFVGSVDKYLFGVMDSTDADLLHKVAAGENALNNQVKQLTEELISLSNYTEHMACIEKHRSDVCVYIEAKMSLFVAQINDIASLYTNLDRAVDDALSNRINSLFMTPKRLYTEMLNVTAHLPPKLSWPVPLEQKNMHHLINNNIVKSHVFITKDRTLLFIVEVPLISQQVFNVYQVVPIPLCSNDGKCAIIVPDSKYLGLSTNLQNYIRLDDDATKICKITLNNLLCYKPNIVYDSNGALLCDIKILLDNKNNGVVDVAKDCDVRIGKFDTEIFYPISQYNHWLYVLQADTKIVFDCDTEALIAPRIIKAGTGIIIGKLLDFNCKISTSKVEMSLVQMKSSLFSVVNLPIKTSFNLSTILNDLDKFEIDNFKSNTDLDHKNLNGMTQRLIDLRKRMENNTIFSAKETAFGTDNDEDNWFCWFVSIFNVSCHLAKSIVATLILMIVFVAAFRLYKCMCPGLCTDIFSCFRRNRATVVRVNSKLQFVDANENNHATIVQPYPSVKYHVGNNQHRDYYSSDNITNDDSEQVFIKKY